MLYILWQKYEMVNKSKRLFFLTGAGISKESKMLSFLGSDGLWGTHTPEKLTSYSLF